MSLDTAKKAWATPTAKIERIMQVQFRELKEQNKRMEEKIRQMDGQLHYLMQEVYGPESDDDERCE